MKTTDDLVNLLRGELRSLLEVIQALATCAKRTRREELICALAFDAVQWCESIGNALETGKWPQLDTAEAIGEECEDGTDYEGALLAFCVRAVRKALPAKPEAA